MQQPITGSSIPPLGVGGDLRRRFLFHHVPLAVSTATVFVLWMTVPMIQAGGRHGLRQGMQHEMQGGGPQGNQGMGGHHGPGAGGHHGAPPQAAAGGSMDAMGHAMNPRGQQRASSEAVVTATGYIALGLIALTLLIGPANLLLGRRVPISNYLSRDVGTWAVIFSALHTVVIARLAYMSEGSGLIASLSHFFVAPDGSVLTNSFGLGNWAGLVALVIAVGLLAISSDVALRSLKAALWKRIQRLNYGLFALVVAHALFYGALLRLTSVSTLLLGLSVIAVAVGQAVGIWLWRRRHAVAARGDERHAVA